MIWRNRRGVYEGMNKDTNDFPDIAARSQTVGVTQGGL